jgi:glycosyltransferase involved in cell wall biosynthesis
LHDLPQWTAAKLPESSRDAWFDSLSRPVGANVVLHFAPPHFADPWPRMRNANFTMFEASRICTAWVEQSRRHDVVILPTESSRQAWIRSGVPEERIRLCPLGVDASLYKPGGDPLDLVLSNGTPIFSFRCRFLSVSELGPRKNLPGLLRAWIRASSPRDDAVLILKIGAWTPHAEDVFDSQLALLEQQIGKRLQDAAPVLFLRQILSDTEMPRLYAAATHYISTSLGEGWDQPMMEAAASGLRLIAPAHSAYPTYLDASTARLLPCREVPAAFEGNPMTATLFRGAAWWEPDEDETVESIQAAIADQEPHRAGARERVLREFTWERVTGRLIEILRALDRPMRRWPFR